MRGLLLAVVAAAAAAGTLAPPFFTPAGGPNVTLTGRWIVNATDGSAIGDWAGISAAVNVNNSAFTYLTAVIEDGCSGNKFAVQMTGNGGSLLRVSTLYTSPLSTRYILFASAGRLSLSGGIATFRLTKAVEARFTQCSLSAPLRLLSFESDAPFLPPPPPSSRRLLLLGDSITSGDLLECCPTADGCGGAMPLPNSLWADDVTLTYGSLLCDAFGADCQTVSWGGIGVAAGDVPTWTWPTLPDAFPWTLGWAGLSAGGPGVPPLLPYNASQFVPAGIISNLGTNDAAGGRFDNATFAALYVSRYVDFLATAAGEPGRPGPGGTPHIFIGYGPMTTAYEAAATNVSAIMTARGYATTLLDLTLPSGQCGCGHPSSQDHAAIAAMMQPTVRAALGW